MTPRKLNKKPVLVVDPEELAREREHLHLVGAQLMGEDDAEWAPADRPASPLSLAATALEDLDYQEYDEQDLPPLGDSFTGPDALLGLSGRGEASEDEAADPAKRVGLDLDALRHAAGLDSDEEEDGFPAYAPDIAAFDSPDPAEEPTKRIGLDLDALREEKGFEQEEDPLSEEAADLTAFDAAVPTELPEKRIGLDLDALRQAAEFDEDEDEDEGGFQEGATDIAAIGSPNRPEEPAKRIGLDLDLDALRKAGGSDEDEEDDDFSVNMPDFSAFRSPAPAKESDSRKPEESCDDADDGSDFEGEPADLTPILPAAPLAFDSPPEPEPKPTAEAEEEPSLPAAPEREPAADITPAVEREPAPTSEPEPEPDYAQEPEYEPEPEPELLDEPPLTTEPTLLRVTNWWPEEGAEAATPQPSDGGPRFVAGPAESLEEIWEEAPAPADSLEPEESSRRPAASDRNAEPPSPTHCQVRARLLRNQDHGVRKPKGLRGWLRRIRLWLEGY